MLAASGNGEQVFFATCIYHEQTVKQNSDENLDPWIHFVACDYLNYCYAVKKQKSYLMIVILLVNV